MEMTAVTTLKSYSAFNAIMSAIVGDDYSFKLCPESIRTLSDDFVFSLVGVRVSLILFFFNLLKFLKGLVSAFMAPKRTSKSKKVIDMLMATASPPSASKSLIFLL